MITDSENTQKATKIEISFIFKFRILVLEFTVKILYVVNFEMVVLQSSIKYVLNK